MDDKRVAVSGMDIGKAIVTALGLADRGMHSTRRITIDIGTDALVKVRVEYYPTAEEMAAVETVLAEYTIVPRTFHTPEGERERCEYAMRILEEYGLSVRREVARQRIEREER